MEQRRSDAARMPIAEDLDDVVQLRAALLDRDRRLIRLRAELVGMQRWVGQLQSQVDELAETVDNARSAVEFAVESSPDLLEPEVEDLAPVVVDDERRAAAAAESDEPGA